MNNILGDFKILINKTNKKTLVELLILNPNFIEYYLKLGNKILDKLNANDLGKILTSQPQLITYFSGEKEEFENRLHELKGQDIFYILFNQPQLIEYFSGEKEGSKKLLNKLNKSYIRLIIDKYPQLEKYFTIIK